MWLAMHEPEKAQELLGREKGYVTFEEIGMCQTKEGIKFDIDYRILENAKKFLDYSSNFEKFPTERKIRHHHQTPNHNANSLDRFVEWISYPLPHHLR